MKLFDVEIGETYRNSCHYYVNVYPKGYGSYKPFKLICLEDMPDEVRDLVMEYLNESNGGSFRPEYAKAIKRGLESE